MAVSLSGPDELAGDPLGASFNADADSDADVNLDVCLLGIRIHGGLEAAEAAVRTADSSERGALAPVQRPCR